VPAQPVYRDLPAINPTPLVEPVETATADNPALTHPTHSARPENVSMHALTRRGMSVAEMTKLLEAREIEPDEVEAELERLQGVGLLDDQALADNLVRTLQDRKGLGRSAISAELRRRKVDQAAIEEALDSIDTDDELVRAIEVATKRAGQLRSYDPETAKRRLFAYLQRRGYGGSVLKAAMTAALEPQHNSQRHSADSRSGSETGGPRFR
jgi:regulatory protein